jgi:hypothetical protein
MGHGTAKLKPDEILKRGQYLESENGKYQLVMERSGDLVLWGPQSSVLWHTGTVGNIKAHMQVEGNLVLYASPGHRAVWATPTGNAGRSHLHMQDDGNAVIYASGHRAVWATGTNPPAPADDDDGGSSGTWCCTINNDEESFYRRNITGVHNEFAAVEKCQRLYPGGVAYSVRRGSCHGGGNPDVDDDRIRMVARAVFQEMASRSEESITLGGTLRKRLSREAKLMGLDLEELVRSKLVESLVLKTRTSTQSEDAKERGGGQPST